MKKLDEIQSFASYLGDVICEERFMTISSEHEAAAEPYVGSDRYTILLSQLSSDDMRQLRIVKSLVDYWNEQNIQLCIYLFVEDTKLIGGQIHKYKIIDYKDGKRNSYELEPTLQEIKVLRRLLENLTKK